MPYSPALHSGLRFPDGNIMQNGDKMQEHENYLMNQDTYWMYFYRLLDIAISVFEWKNLPDGVDARMLEYWLTLWGFVGFFYDEDLKEDPNNRAPEGYAVLPLMLTGKWDLYNYPTDRRAYAVNGFNKELTEDNSVIIFNDQLRIPMLRTIELYAHRLAEADRTIDVNLRAMKTPKIIRCTDKQRLTFKNLMMQVDGNVYNVFSDKSVDLDDIAVLDTTAPEIFLDAQVYKHQIWNEALTYLGVENVNTDKKERLISNEVMSNMGDVEIQRFTRLNPRKQACKEINRLFGFEGTDKEIDVDFRSGMYIKVQGDDTTIIPSSGMKDSSIMDEGSGYGSPGDGAILAKLKSVLGLGA